MRRCLIVVFILSLGVLMFGCADPTADKPKATTGNAAPESSPAKPAAGSEALAITPENSKVEFIGSKVTGSHNGSFTKFSGTIDLAPDNIPGSRVSLDIDTASVSTSPDQLTNHLKTADFFDVAKFPKATFVSTKIEPAASGEASHNVTGNLELHGVKKSITFPAKIQVAADNVTVNADFSINRKDFGIMFAGKSDDLIRDNVAMKLALNVPRKK